jgi:hypothetical protein
MDKGLKKSDLTFALGFLFTLVVAVGAFFYGMKIGADRAERMYAAERQAQLAAAAAESAGEAYRQQDLVSFYHTVFLPYREFAGEWLSVRHKLLTGETGDRAALLKELSRTAGRKYDEARMSVVPPVSPLLIEAREQYLGSLRKFADSFARLANGANEGEIEALPARVEADGAFREAVRKAQLGQRGYFAAMVHWGSSLDPNIPQDYIAPNPLVFDEWSRLPLLLKFAVAADYLAEREAVDEFLPQDLAAKTDQLIRSGQASRLNLASFAEAADLLIGTEAVRDGDYLQLGAQLYSSRELLPQLPFFRSGR